MFSYNVILRQMKDTIEKQRRYIDKLEEEVSSCYVYLGL